MMDVSQYSHTWWQGFHVKYICQLENPLFSPQCSIIYSLLTVTLTARIQNPLLKLTTTHYFPAAKARMNFTTKNWSNLLKSLPVQKRMFASEIISKKCVNIFPLVFFLFFVDLSRGASLWALQVFSACPSARFMSCHCTFALSLFSKLN